MEPATRKVALLLAGFCLALALRLLIGGAAAAASAAAGLVFGGCLVLLSISSLRLTKFTARALGWGLCAAAVLFVPLFLFHLSDIQLHSRPAGNYAVWGLVVSLVAAAEELFLRGKLYDAALQWKGSGTAIILGAVVFAALHIPLYGWRVVPLDLAVGLLLGSLRQASGSWVAPGVTHVVADLGAWWIV